MLRFLLRSLGFILLAGACAALIVDGTRSIAARDMMWFSVADTLGWVFPSKIEALKAAINPVGAEPLRILLRTALTLPTALGLGLAGALMRYAGRRPAAMVGLSGPI